MTTNQSPTLAAMFPIPDEARTLARMLGDWRVEGTMTAEGATLPVEGRWIFEPAAAGWGLACSFEGLIEGMGTYEEHDLVGYDVETGMYHIYSLTNTSAVHDHIGHWTTPDRMDFEFTGTQGGKALREIGSMEIRADGTLRLYSEDQVEGVVTNTIDLVLTPNS